MAELGTEKAGCARCAFRHAAEAGQVAVMTWQGSSARASYPVGWRGLLGEELRGPGLAAWAERIHGDDRPRVVEVLGAVAAGRTGPVVSEFRMRHADGEWRWVRGEFGRGPSEAGSELVAVTHTDVSASRQLVSELARVNRALRLSSGANQALARAEGEPDLLTRLCEIAVQTGGYRMAWIGLVDPGGRIRPVAHAGVEEGYLSELDLELSGGVPDPAVDALSTDRPVAVRDIPRAPGFERHRAAAMRRGYRSALALPLRDGGRPFGVLKLYSTDTDAFDPREVEVLEELATDVALGIGSARARAERDAATAAMQEAVRTLRTVTDALPDFIAQFDREGRFLYLNEVARRATGRSLDELRGRSLAEALIGASDRDRMRLSESLSRVIAGGKPDWLEVEFETVDGPKVFEVRHVPELDEHGGVSSVIGIARDQSERRVAEAALRASEGLYRSLVVGMAEGVLSLEGPTGIVTAVNPAAERILGRPASELLGRPWVVDALRDDGTAFPPCDHPLATALRTGEPQVNVSMKLRRPVGDPLCLLVNAQPLRGVDQAIGGVVATFLDVTERRVLEDRLRQSQKLELVGRLAGGIAHDFNNLLAVVQLQSSLLLERRGLEPRVREGLDDILLAAQRAVGLTRQLLAFGRRSLTEPVDLDLRDVVDGTLHLLRRVLGADIRLRTTFGPALPKVHADPSMIEQVVMNLALNARDAMPGGGRLTVDVDVADVDDAWSARAGVSPGRYVSLMVQDTGLGIPAGDLPKIFEPFFTTKGGGRGTGLGLATVLEVVRQHAGFVEVESDEGHGTSFRVYLPAVVRPAARPYRGPANGPVPGGSETLLVVEDDELLQLATRLALERMGYQVLVAGSAAEAMAAFSRHPGSVDLLLTDLVLPGGTDGVLLAEELLGRAPGLKVLFTSGYNREVPVGDRTRDAGWALVPKPYDPTSLARAVRKRLDES